MQPKLHFAELRVGVWQVEPQLTTLKCAKGPGARLRTLRDQHGWTTAQLAEAAGTSSRTLKRIESPGAMAPGLFVIAAVAHALGESLDELVAYACTSDDPASTSAPNTRQRSTDSLSC
ncbi:helix-turn-helix domain-containing protein [Streptomyces sp. NPDC060205]|uniref:helix-turn-helix domain-containing protein n=1 Tax=Streptomyces sp. NPDC060205 TaxID=3347072 RepID=UPI003657A604